MEENDGGDDGDDGEVTIESMICVGGNESK